MKLGIAKSFSPAIVQTANHIGLCKPEGGETTCNPLLKKRNKQGPCFQTSAELRDIHYLSFNSRHMPTNTCLVLKGCHEPAKERNTPL